MATDQSIITDIRNTYEYEMVQQKELRESSEDNFNYVRGNGWCRFESQKTALENAGKPALSLNLILPLITLILGYNVQNRYDLKPYPAGMGTSDFTARLMGKLIKHISTESNLRFEMSQIVLDSLVANIGGCGRIDWTNENDPMGELLIGRDSPFFHLRDSNNDHYDINKGEYHVRYKWMSRETLLTTFPESKEEIVRFTMAAKDSRSSSFFSQFFKWGDRKRTPTATDYINQRDGLYKVVELWEREIKEKEAIYNLESSEMFEIPKGMNTQYKNAVSRMESKKFKIVKIKPKTIKVKTVLAGSVVLVNGKDYDVQNGLFPFFGSYAYWIDGQPLSNVENLKDYQDEHNKRSSQILHMLNAVGNSGWWVKQLGDNADSVDVDDLVANSTKIGYIGRYKGNTPPQKMEANKLPTGHVYMDEQARMGIRETSGLGENLKGQQESAGESGVLYSKRVQQGEVMLSHFFDNIRLTKEIMGKYLVTAIPKTYTGERIYKIVLDENNEEVLMLNTDSISDITKGKFKVVLDEIDRSPTAKTQEFMELMAFVGSGIPPELVNWAEVIRSSTFPSKEELAAYAEQILGMQLGATPQGGNAVNTPQEIQQPLNEEAFVNA